MALMSATGPQPPGIVTAPVTLPPDFDIHKIAALVRDVAVAMNDLPTILSKHGLTPAQYLELEKNQFFQRVLEDAVQNWNHPRSTKERVALQAAIALEDALPAIAARMSVQREDLADIVATAQLMADLSGMGPKANQNGQNTGEKIVINIDLGGDDKVRIETGTPAPTGLETSATEALQGYAEGTRDGPPIRSFPEGVGEAGALPAFGSETANDAPVRHEPEGDSEGLPPPSKVETGLL